MSSRLSEVGEPSRTGTLLRIPTGRPGGQVEGAARRAGRPASRRTSRYAQPLITALGALTLLAGGSFVVVAASAAGSTQPLDWLRLDWSLVGSHARACLQDHGGPDAIGCILSRVAPSTPAASLRSGSQPESRTTAPPFYSTAMIPDKPTAPPNRQPAKPVSGHPAASTAAAGAAAEGPDPAPAATPRPTARPTPRPAGSPTPGVPDE